MGDGQYFHDDRCRAPFPEPELKRAPTAFALDRMLKSNRRLRSQRVLIETIFGDVRAQKYVEISLLTVVGSLSACSSLFDGKWPGKKCRLDRLEAAFRYALLQYNFFLKVRGRTAWHGFDPNAIPVEPDDHVVAP